MYEYVRESGMRWRFGKEDLSPWLFDDQCLSWWKVLSSVNFHVLAINTNELKVSTDLSCRGASVVESFSFTLLHFCSEPSDSESLFLSLRQWAFLCKNHLNQCHPNRCSYIENCILYSFSLDRVFHVKSGFSLCMVCSSFHAHIFMWIMC